jgi:hypothetical protein
MSVVRTIQPLLNKALYFDGVDDYVGAPSLSMITKSVTSCGWVKVSPTSPTFSFLWRRFHASLGSFGVLIYGGCFLGIIRTISEACTFTQPPYPFSEQWYFVCHRFNRGTRIHELIVNGQVVASFRHPFDEDLPVLGPFEVGRGGTYPSWYYVRGLIAQVCVYNRVLSLAEIQHNMLNPNNPVRDSLVLWFDARATDMVNNKVWDLSGNGNHGTMYNGVQIVALPNQIAPSMVM